MLWELTKKRLTTALVDALQGEVDPRTLEVDVTGLEMETGMASEKMHITVRYELAAIGQREEHSIPVEAEG